MKQEDYWNILKLEWVMMEQSNSDGKQTIHIVTAKIQRFLSVDVWSEYTVYITFVR